MITSDRKWPRIHPTTVKVKPMVSHVMSTH